MAPTRGISGLAVAGIGAGLIVAYSGLVNASIPDTLRALIRGQAPASKPSQLGTIRSGVSTELGAAVGAQTALAKQIAAAGGLVGGQADIGVGQASGGAGGAIAAAALRYVGRPYKWATAGPDTFDCSGLVTWVLHHDLGYDLPDNQHTVTAQFYVWSGATTVPRPPQTGDLICWPSHIGIAINATQMVSAPTAGKNVHVSNIYWTPQPLVRRVTAQISAVTD